MMSTPMQLFSVIASSLSLILSLFTFWMLYFYKGKIKMTQPTLIAFGRDAPNFQEPKIYLRTLIFSTAKRGCIIENIFLKVHQGESLQNFNIWVYGQKNNLSRGSGIYVGQDGIVCDHHFLLPKDCIGYKFSTGDYKIEIYASILGIKKYFLLKTLIVTLNPDHAQNFRKKKIIFFDWAPNTKTYYASTNDFREHHQREDLKINLKN